MKYLKLSREDKTAVISICHAPANALCQDLIKELSGLLDEIEKDGEIRTVIIHGEGRFFSAGADIKEFVNLTDKDESRRLAENGQKVFEKIEKFPKPVIAAIHGAALGGGLELAMACHLRLVADNAKLGLPELQLGLIPGFAGTQRLPRYVGVAKAAEMILTGEPISGAEAVKWGLANRACPEEELLSEAKQLAEKIAKKSPVSVRAVMELLNSGKTEDFYAAVRKEAELFAEVFSSADAKEGISAFLQKRETEFVGR